MAASYGRGAGVSTGTDFKPVALDPRTRAGILTMPAVLRSAAHEDKPSYVDRGVLVLQRGVPLILTDQRGRREARSMTLGGSLTSWT
jgi:hypothetical protein